MGSTIHPTTTTEQEAKVQTEVQGPMSSTQPASSPAGDFSLPHTYQPRAQSTFTWSQRRQHPQEACHPSLQEPDCCPSTGRPHTPHSASDRSSPGTALHGARWTAWPRGYKSGRSEGPGHVPSPRRSLQCLLSYLLMILCIHWTHQRGGQVVETGGSQPRD